MPIEYVTVGEITLDDTVLETGQVMKNQIGGGAVYSALGIRLWGHQVGINAVVGFDYPDKNLEILESYGISVEGIHRINGRSLCLWLLHEANNKKQQLPKLQSANLIELDNARPEPPESYWFARGFHLAPSSSESQIRSRNFIREKIPKAVISLDNLVAPFINLEPYTDGSAYRRLNIFSPSMAEVETLFPDQSTESITRFITGFGVRWIAIKMDTNGSLVHDASTGETYHIPIYPVETVDSTGAGDAYSGGFLEGIVESGSVLEAGLRGTISASFAVQYWGALDMIQVTREEAEERLRWLRKKVRNAPSIL